MRAEILGMITGALAFVAVTAVAGCDEEGMAQSDPRIELEERCKRHTADPFAGHSDDCVAYWLRVIAERRS